MVKIIRLLGARLVAVIITARTIYQLFIKRLALSGHYEFWQPNKM